MNEYTWFNDRRYSKITCKHPDRKIYPDFYKARRMEYILRPGEMIFIPKGWFHFVFSEEPDEETGLCAAINFWYPSNQNESLDSSHLKPKFGWHDIKFSEVYEIIKSNIFNVTISRLEIFAPTIMDFRFPVSTDFMSFEEFYKARNSHHYIAQNKFEKLNKFSIPFETPVNDSTVWINWGHCKTLPHYDLQDNWLCQLQGTRRVILTPNEDRDFMYTFNPYPLELIYKIKTRQEETLIHIENGAIDSNVVKELLEALGNQDEALIECTGLSLSFERELKMQNCLLFKNGSYELPSNIECKIFKIKKYKPGERIQSEFQLGSLWFITKGSVTIRKSCICTDFGDVISYPGNWMYPVKVESECIIITPYGSSNGT